MPRNSTATPPTALVAIPDGITAEEAHQFLQQLAIRGPLTPSKRKRHRLPSAQEAESSPDEDSAQKEFDAEAGFSASHWRIVNSYAKVAWARWFSLPDETYVNKILVKALGADILVTANHLPYDVGYEKIRAWGRQWQCDILKRLTSHVSEIYQKDKEFMQNLNTHGIRQHFARILNIPTIKEIFHCLNGEVDLDDIFNSPAAELYCTFYSNMCEYVLQNRVKPGNDRSKANDDKLFESFRLIAHEEAFADLEVEDIPVRPRKPANKKRHPAVKPMALSQSDDGFKIFGPPGGVTPRLSKKMREKAEAEAIARGAAEGADGFVPAAEL